MADYRDHRAEEMAEHEAKLFEQETGFKRIQVSPYGGMVECQMCFSVVRQVNMESHMKNAHGDAHDG